MLKTSLQSLLFISFLFILQLPQMRAQAPSTIPPRLSDYVEIVDYQSITTGADQIDQWVNQLDGKRVGVVVNTTSILADGTHLVDALLDRNVDVKKIFAPEHGFRADADAGEQIADSVDPKTGLPIISLYGAHKKPTSADYEGLDVIIFDIQDVGVRFYTYISTLEYVIQSCSDYLKDFILLDRPNPNGFYIAGPILDPDYQSFVGRQEIPVVYGMTIGEYAQMLILGGMIKNKRLNSQIITCKNYTHNMTFDLPVKPSPNLPTHRSVLLYPALCLFEGTEVSIGRGTENPFEIYGHPTFKDEGFSFTPQSTPGAKYPKLENLKSYGTTFTDMPLEDIIDNYTFNIDLLHSAYANWEGEKPFFLENNFIDKLAGNDQLRKGIIAGKTVSEIEQEWYDAINDFMHVRQLYLLYD